MSTIWLIGRKVTLATNGHEYIGEPFIAFASEAEAIEACDMVEHVSGERPMMTTAAYKGKSVGKVLGGHARAAALSPEERSSIASKAAKTRWKK
jgi:hypothetical protein